MKVQIKWEDQIRPIKLHMLISLARSERALARMMEAVAAAPPSWEEAEHTALNDFYERVKMHQKLLMTKTKLLGVEPHTTKRRSNKTGKPWLLHPMKRK
ncbi:hypothetical protein NV379_21215 [Paenibacillus sp. N1-5-1-14]|uniref:hypothetical protein n=1 Tax=Paenibacillus radicibacter TaxID=2972488 RepID=UPI002158C550|nr:hypothetical protein [Paenibacillus radicibacter]MCR8645178.1 hypothetical protein [Paenibacillus radicibacter]